MCFKTTNSFSMFLCTDLHLFIFNQAQGKQGAFSLSGMKTKLFGGDTPEQRDAKLKQLEEEIGECEAKVKLTTEQLE